MKTGDVVGVHCPRCQTLNRIAVGHIDAPFAELIVNCDVDVGGCDEAFAVRVVATVHAITAPITWPDPHPERAL